MSFEGDDTPFTGEEETILAEAAALGLPGPAAEPSTEMVAFRSAVPVSTHSRVSAVGLEIDGELGFDEWQQVGSGAGMFSDAARWVRADWACYGAVHFPDAYLKVLGDVDEKTIRKDMLVAEAFPDHEFRARYSVATAGRKNLKFAHFAEVINRPRPEQEFWLERAAEEGLTIQQMRAVVKQGVDIAGADNAPPLPDAPNSLPGHLYKLGPHRLLCGDATDPTMVSALLGEERASMIWTDPPYGVDYVGKTADALTIQNDGRDGLLALLTAAWRAAQPSLVETAPFYVTGPSGDRVLDFLLSFRDAGMGFRQLLCWRKNRMIMGRQDYHYQHESMFYGYGPGETKGGRMMFGQPFRWYGGNGEVSIFDVETPSASKEHPTMKPVKLITPGILNSSRPGEIVLDLFGGSGSTLIACEMTGRRGYLVELDPRYCDVIRKRYADYKRAQKAAQA